MRYTPDNTSYVGKPCDVFVDGVIIPHAVEADDEEGWVIHCVLDENGNITATKSGHINYQCTRGKVTVREKEFKP